jgi:hypothetical protein
MSLTVVVLLAVLWAWMLLPGALREHRERSPFVSINRFERSMGILAGGQFRRPPAEGPPGRHVLVVRDVESLVGAHNRARTLRRRQIATLRLAVLASASIVLAIALRGPAIWAALGCTALLLGYLGMLAQLRANEREARRKTRRLPVAAPRPRTRDTDPSPEVHAVASE